jgi:hypothetical protein
MSFSEIAEGQPTHADSKRSRQNTVHLWATRSARAKVSSARSQREHERAHEDRERTYMVLRHSSNNNGSEGNWCKAGGLNLRSLVVPNNPANRSSSILCNPSIVAILTACPMLKNAL